MARGAFITLYGINNIGKTTQAELLCNRLVKEGYQAVYLKYPIYTLEPTGPELNRILRSGGSQTISEESLQTLFMQNRLDFEPQLRRELEQGKIIIAEDYIGTGIAWGTAKGLDIDWMKNLNKNLTQEDFAILLEGNRDLSAVEQGHIHEESPELIKKVIQILKQLARERHWTVMQTKEKIEDTAEEIWRVIQKYLQHPETGHSSF